MKFWCLHDLFPGVRYPVADGASPSGKAAAFGAAIRRFESCRPSQPSLVERQHICPFAPLSVHRGRKPVDFGLTLPPDPQDTASASPATQPHIGDSSSVGIGIRSQQYPPTCLVMDMRKTTAAGTSLYHLKPCGKGTQFRYIGAETPASASKP